MRDVLVNQLVPDRMWTLVQERLRPLESTAPPVERGTFAKLLVCLFHDLDWTEIPTVLCDPGWNMRALFAECGALRVWETLLADADVTGHRWTHEVAVIGAQRTWRDGAAVLLGAAHRR